jgi:hypothetical protein
MNRDKITNIFIILGTCLLIIIIIVSITNEGFQQQQREVYKEAEAQKLLGQLYKDVKNRKYLNDLIKADYIQSYPWFANNPNGNTSYNRPLFNMSNDEEEITTRSQNYYDFGEITYVGNPL